VHANECKIKLSFGENIYFASNIILNSLQLNGEFNPLLCLVVICHILPFTVNLAIFAISDRQVRPNCRCCN
jgi:hypothetical protein